MDPATTAAAVGGASTDAITALLYGLGMITTTICGVAITYIKMKSTQKRDVGPQPFEVRAASEYMQKPDCIHHLTANRLDHENIFTRLIKLETDTSGIKSDTEFIKKDVSESKNQINRLVWRLIPGSKPVDDGD